MAISNIMPIRGDGSRGSELDIADAPPLPEFGAEGDVVIQTNGDMYKKEDGRWLKKGTISAGSIDAIARAEAEAARAESTTALTNATTAQSAADAARDLATLADQKATQALQTGGAGPVETPFWSCPMDERTASNLTIVDGVTFDPDPPTWSEQCGLLSSAAGSIPQPQWVAGQYAQPTDGMVAASAIDGASAWTATFVNARQTAPADFLDVSGDAGGIVYDGAADMVVTATYRLRKSGGRILVGLRADSGEFVRVTTFFDGGQATGSFSPAYNGEDMLWDNADVIATAAGDGSDITVRWDVRAGSPATTLRPVVLAEDDGETCDIGPCVYEVAFATWSSQTPVHQDPVPSGAPSTATWVGTLTGAGGLAALAARHAGFALTLTNGSVTVTATMGTDGVLTVSDGTTVGTADLTSAWSTTLGSWIDLAVDGDAVTVTLDKRPVNLTIGGNSANSLRLASTWSEIVGASVTSVDEVVDVVLHGPGSFARRLDVVIPADADVLRSPWIWQGRY
jgi:hypothetical protein